VLGSRCRIKRHRNLLLAISVSEGSEVGHFVFARDQHDSTGELPAIYIALECLCQTLQAIGREAEILGTIDWLGRIAESAD
jgi:hypothetical protein